MRHWEFSFIAMMLSVGLAMEIFWKITLLNSVKIAEGPVWPKAVCNASQMALAVVLLVATAATEG